MGCHGHAPQKGNLLLLLTERQASYFSRPVSIASITVLRGDRREKG